MLITFYANTFKNIKYFANTGLVSFLPPLIKAEESKKKPLDATLLKMSEVLLKGVYNTVVVS